MEADLTSPGSRQPMVGGQHLLDRELYMRNGYTDAYNGDGLILRASILGASLAGRDIPPVATVVTYVDHFGGHIAV